MRLGTVAALVALTVLPACAGTPASPMRRAIVLSDKGQYDEAIRLLEAFLAERPDRLAERRLLVRMYGAVGRLDRARQHTEALAHRLGPRSPVPWLELGHALELAHRYDEALSLYDRASAVAPADPSGPRTGGLRAAAWGEVDLAEPRLAEAVRRDPKDARTWHALGVVRVKQGDLSGAERAYRAGKERDPAGIDNRVGLATLALLRGDARQVLAEYEELLRVRPEFVDAHLGRSWALVRLGRFAEASAALDAAERLGADRASLLRQRRWLASELSKSAGTR